MRKIPIALLIGLMLPLKGCAGFSIDGKEELVVVVNANEAQVVHTALALFGKDYAGVFSGKVKTDTVQGTIYAGTIGRDSRAESLVAPDDIRELKAHRQGFLMLVKDKKLIILGSDKLGTAYGIMELSRMMGVSPWEWWADSPAGKKEPLALKEGYRLLDYPAVAYRGIFINDEDWGLCPWSWKNHEPSTRAGQIGPRTHERIFELLLRLRANTFWPAMHECSAPFFLAGGNREVADRYGITIGTSHCEPMQRNTNGEWKVGGTGDYDYVKNARNVYRFWEERVKEVARSNNYFTLGMRGVHDGQMQGAHTIDEQRAVLERVLKDQRRLIAEHVNEDVSQVPQVFIPYKEVLDIYRSGLVVPDDVTLMWCDDNYGYIRHLPNPAEQRRKGGNGIYYHISYWGRPHDYLWLASTSPALMRTELERAYHHHARQYWIINAGDIKPGEYLLEYAMDMAWSTSVLFDRNSNAHLDKWLTREFGSSMASELLPLWNEYYALSYRCRPEFLGNTRTEEKDPAYKVVKDLPWTDSEVTGRLERCRKLEQEIERLSSGIDASRRDHWYQLVEYPIRSFCAMNRKMLGAQLARHGKTPWNEAVKGYEDILTLSEHYNSLANGKWNHIMDYRPRKLPVFEPLDTTVAGRPLPEPTGRQWKTNPSDGSFGTSSYLIPQLGYSREALALAQQDVFTAALPASTDSLTVKLAFVPNHPAGTGKLQVQVDIDGEAPQVLSYETAGRSEEWKMNVLYNQALREIELPASATQRKIRIRALTPAVILDEIVVTENRE